MPLKHKDEVVVREARAHVNVPIHRRAEAMVEDEPGPVEGPQGHAGRSLLVLDAPAALPQSRRRAMP
jgi:hypothetical protein